MKMKMKGERGKFSHHFSLTITCTPPLPPPTSTTAPPLILSPIPSSLHHHTHPLPCVFGHVCYIICTNTYIHNTNTNVHNVHATLFVQNNVWTLFAWFPHFLLFIKSLVHLTVSSELESAGTGSFYGTLGEAVAHWEKLWLSWPMRQLAWKIAEWLSACWWLWYREVGVRLIGGGFATDFRWAEISREGALGFMISHWSFWVHICEMGELALLSLVVRHH